ncbi:eukaryotic translation initiation factor 3 subunit C-like [Haemorhous mexicanus]|uniref:eukaryotic translation initiation factor 3 subunit C-like n=1 Tax=Haemorhous mexicanus TaxID=30427 RepID=UPI0028BF47F6|nr:eukaryotic translation initiation factor 3 subunit C-like [Haemorhous mexicanus]
MMHRTEPTATQNLALQLAEKLGNLVENNERVLDQRQGAYGGVLQRPERRRIPQGRRVPAARRLPAGTQQLLRHTWPAETHLAHSGTLTCPRDPSPAPQNPHLF